MTEDLYLLKKIDPELIKDGFRMLYSNFHREDFPHFVKGYKCFRSMEKAEIEWIQKFLFAVLSGHKSPKELFGIIRDTMKAKEGEADKTNKISLLQTISPSATTKQKV
jgi:hypothetical protein